MKKKYYLRKNGKRVYKCVNTKDKSVKYVDTDGHVYGPEDIYGKFHDEDAYWNKFRNDISSRMLPAIFRARPSFEPEEAVKNAVRFANALVKELKEDKNF